MRDFLWGGAISACQSEGAYDRDGRTPSVFDLLPESSHGRWKLLNNPAAIQSTHFDYYPSHEGINFYESYKDDLRLLKELGINCFRTSISWSRVFPHDDGQINFKALAFYDDLFKTCSDYGMTLVVTLCHFDLPLYLMDSGGWSNRGTIDKFEIYAQAMMARYNHLVRYWIPVNEINMILHLPYIGGGMLLQDEQSKHQAAHNMVVASARMIKQARLIDSRMQVGCMVAAGLYYPNTCDPRDIEAAQHSNRMNYLFTDVQMNGVYPQWYIQELQQQGISIEKGDSDTTLIFENCADYVAISYYSSRLVSGDPEVNNQDKIDGNAAATLRNPYLDITPWGRQIDPLGLKNTLIDISDRYRKPIFIVENGLGAYDGLSDSGAIHDDYRINYMDHHISAMKAAMTQGVDVIGYLVWGIIDVISAGGGEMDKRYGLIYVDRHNGGKGTNRRIPKDSYKWYQEIIKQ